jgi:hypothetical protein
MISRRARFGFLLLTVALGLSACSSQSYDIDKSLRLFDSNQGPALLDQIAKIHCYFRAGRLSMGPTETLATDQPQLTINDPKKISGFFEAMWQPTERPFPIPGDPRTDGLEFVVVMKDTRARPAYFYGYMSSNKDAPHSRYLDAITPTTGVDSASKECPALDHFLRSNYPDAVWFK